MCIPIHIHTHTVCPEKVQPLLIRWEWFAQHQCNLSAIESGLECACVNNDDFTVLVSGAVDSVEWACVLCGCHIQMTEWIEQQIYIKFCIKLELFFAETIWIQMATGMDKWWFTASSQKHVHSCITSGAEFFEEMSNHPGDSVPLWPRFGVLRLWLFPKLTSLWKGRDFRT